MVGDVVKVNIKSWLSVCPYMKYIFLLRSSSIIDGLSAKMLHPLKSHQSIRLLKLTRWIFFFFIILFSTYKTNVYFFLQSEHFISFETFLYLRC